MSDDPVAWLFARQRFGVRPGLERIRGLLDDLGRPQDAFVTTLVGGTNGKGTTTVALAACLSAGGDGAVGAFTSPHLEQVMERFAVDGAQLPLGVLEHALERIRPHAERREATFFEIATAAAALLFAERGVRTAVFEVGLGGRWDATNVLEPVQSVITGVALDHQDVLGPDVATIARDKAGILRPGAPALTGATGDALAVIVREAAELGATLWRVGREIVVDGDTLGWAGQRLYVETPRGVVDTTTRLLGRHQRRNLALAVAAALQAGVASEVIASAVADVTWPGRLERFDREGKIIILDGAHNPDAAAALVVALDELGVTEVTLLVGVGRDKDAEGILQPLAARAAAIVATRAAKSPRAAEPQSVAAAVGGATRVVATHDSVETGLRAALDATPPGGVVLVAGSLYLVGEVRTRLRDAPAEPFDRYQ